MLRQLTIQNYILIDQLNIQFESGYTIVTGETGAGKSILMGALTLITGVRTSTAILKDKSKKATVEATFDLSKHQLTPFFRENDLDYDDTTILRREITPSGKSRAFINDTPVTLSIFASLSSQLIDIHSQHQNLELTKNQYQLWVLDHYAGLNKTLQEYQVNYKAYQKLQQKLHALLHQADTLAQDKEYLQFQYQQLLDAQLESESEEELEAEQNLLTHAEELSEATQEALQKLTAEDIGTLSSLNQALHTLEKKKMYATDIPPLTDRIQSSIIELNDISQTLEGLAFSFEVNPSRLTYLNEKISTLFNLKKRYKVDTVEALIKVREDLREQLSILDGAGLDANQLKQEISVLEETLQRQTQHITNQRKKFATEIEQKVHQTLTSLSMPNVRFAIQVTSLAEFAEMGVDKVEFLFSANKHLPLSPMGKVVSGGELSRVMLSVKALIADNLPTLFFDEIDTGISGEVAYQMGTIIHGMSSENQIIQITHLPQIASKGHHHYVIQKIETVENTHTQIEKIEGEARVREIAKMLSGDTVTNESLANATVLLQQ